MTDEEILAQLIKEKLTTAGIDDDFAFGGDENCKGGRCSWDGEDRRCDCGNRRVTWQLSDDKKSIYAEAY